MTTRRAVIANLLPGAAAAVALTVLAPRRAAAAERLSIFSHAVHKSVSTTGPGGDVTASWREKNGVEVEWLTSGVEATNERAFKEASLGQGNANIVFLLDRIRRAHARASRIFAVHTDDRRGLHASRAMHVFEMDHRLTTMRAALAARLHACLTADAA